MTQEKRVKQIAQEDEIKDHIRQHYERVGREALIGIAIDRRDDREPNWTACATPKLRDFDDRRAFIAAVFQVQRLYDLSVD